MPDSHSARTSLAPSWEMRELAVRMHADSARMAELVCAFADGGDWRRAGVRSCADWVMANLGFDRYTTDKLLRAGVAARRLPAVAEAFSAGELSLDTVGMLSSVATAEDQGAWVEVARDSSPPQLARRCREAHRAALIDAPDRARVQRAQRGLRSWWDLGMLQLRGALPPEEGARFRLSLEKQARRLASKRPAELTPADDPAAALRADALVALCTAGHGGASAPSPAQLVVHVDLGVLTGETPDGRCHILDGPAISAAAARRLGCDATMVTLLERDGQVVGGGPERPGVTSRMRRAVQGRDGTCRYPGCAIPATRTDAHHNRHHDGEYDIRRTAETTACWSAPPPAGAGNGHGPGAARDEPVSPRRRPSGCRRRCPRSGRCRPGCPARPRGRAAPR